MDSLALTRPSILSPLLPMAAVLTRDLRMSLRHWALWSWLIVSALTTTMYVIEARQLAAQSPAHPVEQVAEEGEAPSAAPRLGLASVFVARLLRFQIFFGMTFALILAATSLPTDADIAAEAILSRGIARIHYYFAKLVSRAFIVVLSSAMILVVSSFIAMGKLHNDITLMAALQVAGSVAILFGSISVFAFALSGWFRNGLVCIAVVWMFVYGTGIVTSLLDVPQVSPVLWMDQLAPALRNADTLRPASLALAAAMVACVTTSASLISYSSKDV